MSGSVPSLANPKLLTDPFLQHPEDTSISVVWFTGFPGKEHVVEYGDNLEQTRLATTTRLSRAREDRDSWVGEQRGDGRIYRFPTRREIWRHEARVTNLVPNKRILYRVVSTQEDDQHASSRIFSLSPRPDRGQPVKILLTSDHQMLPMAAANAQRAAETAGRFDAVFFAGDLVNVPDRASEWFDDNRGASFFPVLQGNAAVRLSHDLGETLYRGGEIIQHAPIFPVIGNHDVMGRFSMIRSLNFQSDDTWPREVAQEQYLKLYATLCNPKEEPTIWRRWVEDNSFNAITFSEVFTLPPETAERGPYYSQRIGDVYLIALCVSRTWRIPGLEPDEITRGAYDEVDVNNPANWGYGAHIFHSIAPGSPQHLWLVEQLRSPEFRTARYKVVMLHHSCHSLGLDVVPPFSDPIRVVHRDTHGRIVDIRYEYAAHDDYLVRDLEPILQEAGVNLILTGHNHLWNRFVGSTGIHFLETSNVGNTHGAYWRDNKRHSYPPDFLDYYVSVGDPNGLAPVVPNIRPLTDKDGQPLPYLASNYLSAFSILDTNKGTVSSYYLDTREASASAVKFDEFGLV